MQIPKIIVILFCLLFAVQLGIFEPEFHFYENKDALASKNKLLFFVPSFNNTTSTLFFEGKGNADFLKIESQGANISKILLNGHLVCSPCNSSKNYQLQDMSGNITLKADILLSPPPKTQQKPQHIPFVAERNTSQLYLPLLVSIQGSWEAAPNKKIPSSFYNIDAPFHIYRTGILADCLKRLEWPYSSNTFLSVFPPSLIVIAFGTTPQYAYKIYHILLYFFPIILFYLFSSKLSKGREAVFLLSSLLYLSMPSTGMITGSGTDLFLMGLTSHTLATYLSLLFLYFAYEFLFEEKKKSSIFAALFFFLSVLSNQRIILALFFGLFMILTFALLLKKTRKALLLSAACIFSVAWFLLSVITPSALSGSPLGGAEITRLEDAFLSFFLTSYFILPVLFAAGAYASYKRKELFSIFLISIAVIIYIFTTNPAINEKFPFIDGLRHLPSFYIPAFFVAGIGIHFFLGFREKIRKKLKMDKITFGGAFALAIVLPASAIFFAAFQSTTEQYSGAGDSLLLASEYSSLEKISEIIGESRTYFTGGMVSQYPVYIPLFEKTTAGPPTNGTAEAKYLIFGNKKWGEGIVEDYSALKNSENFNEINDTGIFKLFEIKNYASKISAEVHPKINKTFLLPSLFLSLACLYLANRF